MEENNNGTQENVEQKTEETKAETKTVETKNEEKPKKEGWFKKHWKGVAAGAAGVAGAAASVFVAYMKGKKVGIAGTVDYYEKQNVSPLDPNVE